MKIPVWKIVGSPWKKGEIRPEVNKLVLNIHLNIGEGEPSARYCLDGLFNVKYLNFEFSIVLFHLVTLYSY